MQQESRQQEAAIELLKRREARKNLHSFIRYINPDYIVSDFSRRVCEALDEFIIKMINGERPVIVLGAPPQHGKLMADETPVLTINGWKTHGDLKVGDYVYGSKGLPVKVLAVSEKSNADMRVELNNGNVFYCHEKHEWTVYSRDKKRELTLETEAIASSNMVSGELGKRGSRLKFSIPNRPPIDGADIDLPIHPYALGVWLGDGTQTKPYISYDEKDSAVINELDRLGYKIEVTYKHKDTQVLTSKVSGLKEKLLDMGLMAKEYGVRLKKIPESYLTSSLNQRLELLAGLIDTDGYCYQKNGRVVFTTADKLLADTFCELVSTFGWSYSRVTEKPKLATSGIQGVNDYYVIGFNPTLSIPCRLNRKVNKPTLTQRRVGIRSITKDPCGKVGNCIQVDADDGLYMIGRDMILTHNSDIVSRYLPAYTFGNYPDLRIAGLSYAKDLASDMNRDVQRIMMSEEYARLFPESCLNSKRVVTVELEAKRNSETFEIVGRKGTYISQGVGGPLTGKKVDLGIIDDPIKNAKEALSGTIKNAVWNWYVSTFKTRLSKNSGEIIMATRWAVDDLSGKVIEKNKNAKVLAFPAIDDFGRALVPELHPVEKLLETKAILGSYFWSAMYQQSPVPEDGGIFKPENIQIVDALPAGIKWIRGWDFAGTIKKTSDYTSSTKLGVKDGVVYIANVDRFRGAPDDVENRLKQISTMDGYETLISLPQDPGQAGVYQKSAFSRLLQGMNFEFSPESGDKLVRAAPFASQVNVGNVKMLKGDWNSDFIDELRDFPNGAHDDMVDSTSRAYNKAAGKPLTAFDVLF